MLLTHQLGWELRVESRELLLTQVCRSDREIEEVSGWMEGGDDRERLEHGVAVKTLEVLVGGAIIIGGILAACGFAMYLLWWVSLIAIWRLPMIGGRHKHANWDRLNRQ